MDQGMKKISKFGALAVSFVTLAHTVKSAEISHNINVGAGVGWTYGRFNFRAAAFDPGSNTTLNREFDLGKNSFASDASLGYRLRWKNIMGGIEADYLFMGLKRTGNPNSLSDGSSSRPTAIKSNGAFGAVLKLGYYLKDDFVVYAGAGVENRKFKIQYLIQDQPENSVDRNYTQTAFAGRLGFDFTVSPYMVVGAEYRKAFYNGQTIQTGTTTLKFQPETLDTLLLNVRFTFNLSTIKSPI